MKKQKRDDIVSRADEAFGNMGYAEFSVKKSSRGSYRLARIAVILGYILIIGGLCVLLAIKFPMGIAIMPILGWMLVFFTWRYFSIEYKYTVDHSTFTAYAVYGGKSEKTLVKLAAKDIERALPFDPLLIEGAQTFDLRPSPDCADCYMIIGTSEGGKRVCLLFEATNGILKALRFYNSKAVVMSELSK